MVKFKVGDRVVAVEVTELEGGHGVVTLAEDGAYDVLFDEPENRGPFGDGGMYMREHELEYEEEK